MNERFNKLKALLVELFQLDQPDLDFGLYRVMHAKSGEIKKFLEDDLLPSVKSAFAEYQPADKAAIESELEQAITNLRALGVANPEESAKVKELRERLASEAVDIDSLEADAFDHLYSFFRRYYSEGDFLSNRVYKSGVYAIPYEGEEVKLHWANADQYYIKTSEYLRDYAFRLCPDDEANPMRVHFRLVDATEGEHGDVKEQSGKERRFQLVAESPVTLENGELAIGFTYEPDAAQQKDLNSSAEQTILGTNLDALADWIRLLGAPHLRADGSEGDSTRLRVNLDRYTARNTFDYFVHKDLGGFLRRELDFYIKNEVMHLDDVESESVPRVEQYLSKIKVIRHIAAKVIDFLAQLEDFQKKLWLKKKFVFETFYCIRLGIIPDEFYAEVASNEAQRREWVILFDLDGIGGEASTPAYSVPLTTAFLKAQPALIVNTQHFAPEWTERLIGQIQHLSDDTDGILFHGENLQCLRLIRSRYRSQLDCVYIDPPYNTDASPIAYKNGYRRSSWIALLADRLTADFNLRKPGSLRCIAIDDFEYPDLIESLSGLAPEIHHATVSVRSKPQGRPTTTGFSANHEYAVFWGGPNAQVGRLPRLGSKAERYPYSDEYGVYSWANFRKSGTDSNRIDRRKSYYPVYVSGDSVRIPGLVWSESDESWQALDEPIDDEIVVFPIDANDAEKVWTCSADRAKQELSDIKVDRADDGRVELQKKYRPNQDGALPGTWWDDSSYSASESGTKLLKDLFGKKTFDYPKSVHLVRDCLRVAGLLPAGCALDYFAGSGTTGHAVINLNRVDGGGRKFILVEQGQYFDTVLVPRLMKVSYAPEWQNAKPERRATVEETERSPRIMKIIRLESYEDALNNLELKRTVQQQSTLDFTSSQGTGRLKERYTLRYMLDVETRGSQSLLNVSAFIDPTAYKLRVKRPGSDETREVNVDLLETFNWLIGLTVQQIAAPHTTHALFKRDDDPDLPHDAPRRLLLDGDLTGDAEGKWWFRTVTGTTPDGRKTLVIWRKRPGGDSPEGVEGDNLILNEWFKQQGYGSKERDFDLIYVNGGNNLENLKAPDDKWSARIIEDDFHRLMFETDAN